MAVVSQFDAKETQHIARLRKAYGLSKSGDDFDFFEHEDSEEDEEEDGDGEEDEEDGEEDGEEDEVLKAVMAHLLVVDPIDLAVPFLAERSLPLSILCTDAISVDTDAIPDGLLDEHGFLIL